MADINGYSDYYATALQEHGMAVSTYTAVSTFYVGLAPQSDVTYDGFDETYSPGTPPDPDCDEPFAYGDYARKDVPAAGWEMEPAGALDATLYNNADIRFVESSAAWGPVGMNIGMFGVFDGSAQATGNLLWGGSLVTPKRIEINTIAVFVQHALKLKSKNSV